MKGNKKDLKSKLEQLLNLEELNILFSNKILKIENLKHVTIHTLGYNIILIY
jgi:hypothetical protein